MLGRTHEELLDSMSGRELAEWMAFYQVEPFGDVRGDLQAGIVASTLANVYRDRKKKPKPYKPEEFMPKFERPKRAPRWGDVQRHMMRWMR
ncbi:MAG: DUF4035 domain-containing protein [Caldilineaceae bacterium]|nr:DUF4035 domain-containing protein [Caldilineaceae bacterium]